MKRNFREIRVCDMTDNRTKKIVVVMLVLGSLVQLYAAVLHGMRAEWFRFGLSLGGCLIATIAYTAILIAWKIDTRFNQLEELLRTERETEKSVELRTLAAVREIES